MTITITIPAEKEARVRDKAAAAGQDPLTFVAQAALRAIDAPTLAEISGPLQAEFAATGMTDDELGDFLEDVKHKMRREQDAAKP